MILDNLEGISKIAEVIIKPIENIVKGIMNLKDNKLKKEELNRLMKLLNATRIGRTLNSNLLFYLRDSIESYQSDSKKSFVSKDEINIAIEQIESSISAILSIVDGMVEKSDKVLIYENKAWTDLSLVVMSRRSILNDLKSIELNKQNLKKLEHFANEYEKLTNELGHISFEISKYAQELDKKKY